MFAERSIRNVRLCKKAVRPLQEQVPLNGGKPASTFPSGPTGQIIQRYAEVVRNAHEIFKSRQIDPGLKPLVLPIRHTDGVGHLSLGLLPLFAEFPHSLLQCHIVTS